ncbi:MAG: MnhB domain-containing protein [Myxococcota bacterium]
MHESPILRTVARIAVPLTLLLSLLIFEQGHDHPGGGFIAGVIAAAAGAMYLLAFGLARAARIPWWRVSIVGLLCALMSGAVPYFTGSTFMDHRILEWELPLLGHGHLPSATFFDLGVYLIVLGTLMTLFVELGLEERRWNS